MVKVEVFVHCAFATSMSQTTVSAISLHCVVRLVSCLIGFCREIELLLKSVYRCLVIFAQPHQKAKH